MQEAKRPTVHVDSEGRFELGNKKLLDVRKFKGKILIDVREYYEEGGALKPGRKGISLSLEQWRALESIVGEVDKKIETL